MAENMPMEKAFGSGQAGNRPSLADLQRIAAAEPAAARDLAAQLDLPAECGDLDDGITGSRKQGQEPSHDEIVYETVEQYLGYFLKLPTCRHTSPPDLHPGTFFLFITHVPWLRPMEPADAEKVRGIPPIGFVDCICTELLRARTLGEFLHKKGPGARDHEALITDETKYVFGCLRDAAKSSDERKKQHWRIVQHFLKKETEVLAEAQSCLSPSDPKPLRKEVVDSIAECFSLGSVRADYCLECPGPWHFNMVFQPLFRRFPGYPHQLHVAKLLASPVAFRLCIELQEFSASKEKDTKNRGKFRLIRKCRACHAMFYTGRDDAVTCTRRSQGLETGKSDCRRKYDSYCQRYLPQVYKQNQDKYGHLSLDEFNDQHANDPEVISGFTFTPRKPVQ